MAVRRYCQRRRTKREGGACLIQVGAWVRDVLKFEPATLLTQLRQRSRIKLRVQP